MRIDHIDAAALLDRLSAGVVVHAADTRLLYANPKALEILRLSEEQAFGRDSMDPQWRFLDRFKRPLPVAEYPVSQVVTSGAPVSNMEIGIIDSRGDITWVMINAYPERDAQGGIDRVVVTFIDITDSRRDIPFEQVVAFADDAVVVTEASPLDDSGPRIVYANDAFSDITGYTPEEVLGLTPRVLQGPDTDPETRQRIRAALEQGEPVREEILNYTKGGRPYWIDMHIVPLRTPEGDITHYAAIERDITQRKRKETLLADLAFKDPLTGLNNRRGFAEIAQSLLANAQRQDRALALAMLDIDHFKRVNDSHGHDAGDEVLCALARTLRTSVRESDVLGRFGGEEFAILLPGADGEGARGVLEKCRSRVAEAPITLRSGTAVPITVSIGFVTLSPEVWSLQALIKRADMALYDAKGAGRNRVICALPPPLEVVAAED